MRLNASSKVLCSVHQTPPWQISPPEPNLAKLLELLLGADGMRQLKMMHMNNDEIFQHYDNDLMLRLHNAKNLLDTRRILARGICHGAYDNSTTYLRYVNQASHNAYQADGTRLSKNGITIIASSGHSLSQRKQD